MAKTVCVIASTHNPRIFWNRDNANEEDMAELEESFGVLRAGLAEAAPDVIIAVANDHLDNFFFDHLPSFAVATGPVAEGPFWYESEIMNLPSYRCDVHQELEGILRELYALLSRNRTGIELLDRCSSDHPDLAAAWYGTGREGALTLLTQYLEDRIARHKLRSATDVSVAARITLETLVFWAVHRHWDPSPQRMDEASAEDSVVAFILNALTKEPSR